MPDQLSADQTNVQRVKCPEAGIVKLIGVDSNVFSLMGVCTRAMRKAGCGKERINEFTSDITSSESYDAALWKMQQWFMVD